MLIGGQVTVMFVALTVNGIGEAFQLHALLAVASLSHSVSGHFVAALKAKQGRSVQCFSVPQQVSREVPHRDERRVVVDDDAHRLQPDNR